jgi:enoyl-CoA hydratase/carnithine racemase
LICSLKYSTDVALSKQVDGIAYAAGNELIMNMDMRFAGPRASMGAPEAVCGVLHVGGIQQLTALVGPGYANQYLISGLPISGRRAAEIGWVNEYYDSSAHLASAVNALATRIALFPWTGITSNKKAIRLSGPTQEMIGAGKEEFFGLVTQPYVQECVVNWLALDGGNITDTKFQRNLLSLLPEVWTMNSTS